MATTEKIISRQDANFWADIIVLKNNSLENIDAIKNVHFVMKEGEVIKND